ncbi:MAG TPA: hypothetical protein VE173_14895, partial [Longimicrobiales bacterium]|nr:hypothetical protein [Longimicrobiales bacterium]
VLLLVAVAAPVRVAGQQASWNATEVLKAEDYQRPPQTIVEAALAPRWLNVSLTSPSPDKRWFLNEVGDGPVRMDRFSRPFHDLGGEFIDFRANRDRTLTIRNSAGLEVVSAEDGSRIPVDVPRGARISGASFSPDGSRIAFFAHFDDATQIFVADPETGDSRQVTRRPVLATLVTSFQWTENGRIGTVLVPDDRPPMPASPDQPTGPRVKITEEGENRLRTYASLMAAPYDETLLEWDATGQLALIDVGNRRVTEIGEPTMVRSFDFAPTGEYVRVTRMVKPFSYVVPVSNFGRIEEIWDLEGNVLAALDTTELNTGIRDDDQPGFGGRGGGGDTQQGRRALTWRKDGQGLSYLEQEPAPEGEDTTAMAAGARGGRAGGGAGGRASAGPGGGEQGRARRPDRVMQWLPPFDEDSKRVVYESDTRIQSVSYSEDYRTLFLTERQGSTTHQYAVFLDDPDTRHTLYRWNSDDFYENPGSLVGGDGRVSGGGRGGFGGFGRGGGGGGGTVLTSGDGSSVFLAGTRYDEDPLEVGPTPFIDRIDIRTGDKERIFEGDNDGAFERATVMMDTDGEDLVVSRESPTEVEQFYRVRNGTRTQLTENVDYTPDLTNAPRE